MYLCKSYAFAELRFQIQYRIRLESIIRLELHKDISQIKLTDQKRGRSIPKRKYAKDEHDHPRITSVSYHSGSFRGLG